MNSLLRSFRDLFVSLRLTVVLLVVAMVLVFAATLDQANLGVWAVQEKYFRSFFVLWHVPATPVSIPVFPGGYLTGGLLLINLLFAHFYRFRPSWSKLGIHLAHTGLVILLLGELSSGLLRQDSSMRLEEGSSRNYSESFRDYELVLISRSGPAYEEVVSIPETILAKKIAISDPHLPFTVLVRDYFPNASLLPVLGQGSTGSRGFGTAVALLPEDGGSRQGDTDTPGAYIEIRGPEGSLGTWLVSPLLKELQIVAYGNRAWGIALRPKRYYTPYSLTLLKVTNDAYPGTNIPKNFVSRVRVTSADGKEDREAVISMNHPLRFGGCTYYQYQMNAPAKMSVLEVVHNPSWPLPYLACSLLAVGLGLQFGLSLLLFFRKPARPESAAAPESKQTRFVRLIPVLVLICGGVYALARLPKPAYAAGFDLGTFGELPVQLDGRVKPLDTVARTSLLMIEGRQSVEAPEEDAPKVASPSQWLAEVVFNPGRADTFPVFKIDSPDLRTVLGLADEDIRIHYSRASQRVMAFLGILPTERTRFSYNQLGPKLDELERQARLAESTPTEQRTPYQRHLLEFRDRIQLYLRLKSSLQTADGPSFQKSLLQFERDLGPGRAAVAQKKRGQPYDRALEKEMREMAERFNYMEQLGYLRPIPPDQAQGMAGAWRTEGMALLETFEAGKMNPSALAFAQLGQAWRTRDCASFNGIVHKLHQELSVRFADEIKKNDVEVLFNRSEPFYSSLILYSCAFLAALVSWLKWPKHLGRAAYGLVAVAWAVETSGIAIRMWLEGRPPVTNLYSSALFVGWGSVALCLILEVSYRNAMASVAAGMIGFASLLIAHHLSLAGDTLEMMRAVLDSNFWLATHVVVVTLGYASTFLAGFLALIYIFRSAFTRSFDEPSARALVGMVYGVVCFATLFSLVGTILGGIWADQSWGRFWGWDPKENGALIIVIWNAVILHSRWSGIVRNRGLMVMAVFGNVVTSWSWFGVNMLGVGLHSYGFMESAFYWLIAFVLSQLLVMGLAFVPGMERFGPKRASDSS